MGSACLRVLGAACLVRGLAFWPLMVAAVGHSAWSMKVWKEGETGTAPAPEPSLWDAFSSLLEGRPAAQPEAATVPFLRPGHPGFYAPHSLSRDIVCELEAERLAMLIMARYGPDKLEPHAPGCGLWTSMHGSLGLALPRGTLPGNFTMSGNQRSCAKLYRCLPVCLQGGPQPHESHCGVA